MSFPRYPEYKDSGVEWLGEVPAHWEVVQLRRCAASIQTGGTPPRDPPTADLENGFDWFTPGDFGDSLILRSSTRRLPMSAIESGDAKIFPPGTVLIVSIGATLGRVGIAESESSANQQINAVVPNGRIDTHFLGWSLSVKAEVMRFLSNASTIGIMNQERTKEIWIALPPGGEQSAIKVFLDHETAKIDALVEEQQRLIELLKEKRQAVISQAVTKGLDPNVPMKDSGVEWLGKVPAHWEVRSIRTLASVVRGASPRPAGDPAYFNGDYLPWVTVAEITKDRTVGLRETESYLTEAGVAHSRVLKSGTVIYSNSGATLGVPKILKVDACANDGVVGFEELSEVIDPLFLYHYLDSLTQTIRDMVKQGSGQPNLNTSLVKAIPIPLPPPEEQLGIVANIDMLLRSFDVLSREAEHATEILQERRAALIAAAVTGKIDVRGLAS